MKIAKPSKFKVLYVFHPEHGPGEDLGPAPKRYSTPHTVVKFKRTGLIMRVPTDQLKDK